MEPLRQASLRDGTRPDRTAHPVLRLVTRLGWVIGRAIEAAGYPSRLAKRIVGRRRPTPPKALLSATELAAEDGLTKLAAALSDPDPATRTLALEVTCELSEERAARLISSMLHDSEPHVRAAAAAAAGRLRATATVFSLILALDDAESIVRGAAGHAIEAITGRRVELENERDAAQRKRALEELKRWWKEQRVAELEQQLEA